MRIYDDNPFADGVNVATLAVGDEVNLKTGELVTITKLAEAGMNRKQRRLQRASEFVSRSIEFDIVDRVVLRVPK